MVHVRTSAEPQVLPVQSFLGGSRRTLKIPAPDLSRVQYAAWRAWPYETGGILLGHTSKTTTTVSVVIGPGPKAQHERHGFTPDADWQAAEVAKAWNLDRSVEYLGDWHTHPGGTTRFSDLDRQAAVTISRSAAARQPRPVLLVLALGSDGGTGAAAAFLVNGKLRPARISVVQQSP